MTCSRRPDAQSSPSPVGDGLLSRPMPDFTDAIVLITGAASGIGAAVATRLANERRAGS